jgi:hypothetical protein
MSKQTNFMDRQTAVNGFSQLEKMKAPPAQEYCVIVYFLSDKIGPDGCHGLWFLRGTYSTEKEAKASAVKIIEKTGIQTVYATRTCSWQEINDQVQSDRTKMVPVDKESKLRHAHEKEQKRLSEKQEQERQLRQEIEDEISKESDPNSIEYYTQQWFRAIKSKTYIENLKNEIESHSKNYNEAVNNLQESYKSNPTHEEKWLPTLEEKLERRGELGLFEALKLGSEKLRNEILY